MATHQEARERRAGENQSLFRDVNERVRQAKDGRTNWMGTSQWMCECADVDCTERIRLSLDEYEQVRADPTHFAVFPEMAHVVPDAERIVEKHEHFWVVEKVREAGGDSRRTRRSVGETARRQVAFSAAVSHRSARLSLMHGSGEWNEADPAAQPQATGTTPASTA